MPELFTRIKGKKVDADLHAEILNVYDDSAALQVAYQLLLDKGWTEEKARAFLDMGTDKVPDKVPG